MDHYIVIGVSTGIGRALVEKLLEHGKIVYGIGRNNSIKHKNYEFLKLDLSDVEVVSNFRLPSINQSFALIYNAGVLGEILPLTQQTEHNAQHVFQVNYLSAVNLCQKALNLEYCQQLLFISSGAAKRAIPSWSQYCASKAALDIFAQTLYLELQQKERKCRVFSIAPGVVDTPMQTFIRSCNETDFPQVEHFRNLHTNRELTSPKNVAEKLFFISQNPEKFQDVCFSLREV